jgi:hypothetical protein
MTSNTVTIPEGHQIIVVHPSDVARIGQLQCGILVVDYGNDGDWNSINLKLDEVWPGRTTSTLVVLQKGLIESLRRSNQITTFFSDWKRRASSKMSTLWVLPLKAAEDANVIAEIHEIGCSVHASAPDGACFVEVHKPDGSITIGMPGPAL